MSQRTSNSGFLAAIIFMAYDPSAQGSAGLCRAALRATQVSSDAQQCSHYSWMPPALVDGGSPAGW